MTSHVPPVVVMGVSGSGKTTIGTLLAERPWLALIGAWLRDSAATGGGVAACSALARRYRDLLRRQAPDVWFLHLDAGRDVVARRVARRRGHFMPATLVDSQLQTLEPLAGDEHGLRVNASDPSARIVDAAVAALTRAAG